MRTHLIAALLLLFTAGCWPLAAGADADSHRQAVERLFELTDMQEKIAESVDNVLAIQLGQNPSLREHHDLLRAFLEKHIGWDGLKDDILDMYLNTFTEPELNERLLRLADRPQGDRASSGTGTAAQPPGHATHAGQHR